MRKLRAALVIAGLWAIVWMPMGFALALYAGSRSPQPTDVIARPVSMPAFISAWTMWGGMSGALFAFILGVAERRRTLAKLSFLRTVLWGAIGCVTLPAVLTIIDALTTPAGLRGYTWRFPLAALAVSAALGAACAAATLAVARRPG